MDDSTHATALPPNDDPVRSNNTGSTTTLWQRIAPGLLLLLAVFFNFFRLGQNRFADINTSVNTYYAAAVKSMLMSWHNFFFAAFDPGGFLALDKPPVGFWIQAASARIFGFSQWSLLLPEALAGVGSVMLLYILVRKTSGPNAGLLAGLALALMPISVVTSRNNTIDSLLVLTLLFAAWTLLKATETGRLRWLLLSACLVGLGFNIKMLEAYVILPAFAITYLVGAPRPLGTRLIHLLLATLVLLLVSFSWITAVDIVPPGQRPYVSSTQSDSELELAIGYNGISRITGIGSNFLSKTTQTQGSTATRNATTLLVVFGIANTGFPGPLRLIGPLLGGQIGWLLLFSIFALIAVCRWKRVRSPLTPRQQGQVLWGTWFVTLLLFFSIAFFDHPYYMVTFAPAVCALIGIGGREMYQAYCSQVGWRSWLLPFALITTALVQAFILSTFPTWRLRLTPLILGVSLLVVVLLISARLLPRFSTKVPINLFVASGLLTLLIAPALWAALPLWEGTDTINPTAGPRQPINSLGLLAHAFLPEVAHGQSELIHYLQTQQGDTRYLVATVNAPTAASFILDTGKPVIALGGYNGFDQIVTAEQVATLVQQKEVRFFLLPSFAHIPLNIFPPSIQKVLRGFIQAYNNTSTSGIMQNGIAHWVTAHCTLIPRTVAEPGTSGPDDTVDVGSNLSLPAQLFDCAHSSS